MTHSRAQTLSGQDGRGWWGMGRGRERTGQSLWELSGWPHLEKRLETATRRTTGWKVVWLSPSSSQGLQLCPPRAQKHSLLRPRVKFPVDSSSSSGIAFSAYLPPFPPLMSDGFCVPYTGQVLQVYTLKFQSLYVMDGDNIALMGRLGEEEPWGSFQPSHGVSLKLPAGSKAES